jgi:hypothetical protein
MAPAKLEKTTISVRIDSRSNNSGGETIGEVQPDALLPGAKSAPERNGLSDGIVRKGGTSLLFEAKGEVVVFDGFLRVYGGGKDELLPAISSGDSLVPSGVEARQVFARPPARYTEGSLVKKLEELGIGRPSTYATIIDTVQTRGYVERGEGEGEPREVVVLRDDEEKHRSEEVGRGVRHHGVVHRKEKNRYPRKA